MRFNYQGGTGSGEAFSSDESASEGDGTIEQGGGEICFSWRYISLASVGVLILTWVLPSLLPALPFHCMLTSGRVACKWQICEDVLPCHSHPFLRWLTKVGK